jgi:hypothetical protein
MPYRAGPRVGFLIDMRGDMRRHHMDPAHGHGTISDLASAIWLRMHKISDIGDCLQRTSNQ